MRKVIEVNWIKFHVRTVILSNITLLGVAIILIWLAALGYYFYTSRQQTEIINEIDELRTELEDLDDGSDRSSSKQVG